MSVVVLTGAGRGIGREIALRLARDGHRLALTARTVAELDETRHLVAGAGGEAVAVPADVSAPADVNRVCLVVEERFGVADALVNCAGFYGECEPFVDSDPEVWWRVLETNLRGPMLLLHRLLPAMVAAGGGRVVNLSTRMAFDTEASVPFSGYASPRALCCG